MKEPCRLQPPPVHLVIALLGVSPAALYPYSKSSRGLAVRDSRGHHPLSALHSLNLRQMAAPSISTATYRAMHEALFKPQGLHMIHELPSEKSSHTLNTWRKKCSNSTNEEHHYMVSTFTTWYTLQIPPRTSQSFLCVALINQ